MLGNADADESSSDFHDAVDVLESMIHPNSTEGDLVLVDCKVPMHELLICVWICDLKSCHLCKVE